MIPGGIRWSWKRQGTRYVTQPTHPELRRNCLVCALAATRPEHVRIRMRLSASSSLRELWNGGEEREVDSVSGGIFSGVSEGRRTHMEGAGRSGREGAHGGCLILISVQSTLAERDPLPDGVLFSAFGGRYGVREDPPSSPQFQRAEATAPGPCGGGTLSHSTPTIDVDPPFK